MSISQFRATQTIMIALVLFIVCYMVMNQQVSRNSQHLQNISLIIEVYLNSKHYLMVKCEQLVFRRRNDNRDMSSSVNADLQAKLWENLKRQVGTRRTTYKHALEK